MEADGHVSATAGGGWEGDKVRSRRQEEAAKASRVNEYQVWPVGGGNVLSEQLHFWNTTTSLPVPAAGKERQFRQVPARH